MSGTLEQRPFGRTGSGVELACQLSDASPAAATARSTMGTCAGLRDQTTVLSVLPEKCLP